MEDVTTIDVLISLIEKLEEMANENGAIIYNICHRNAGWGIQWHESYRCSSASDDWRKGLVVYKYYPTLFEAVQAELERLKALH